MSRLCLQFVLTVTLAALTLACGQPAAAPASTETPVIEVGRENTVTVKREEIRVGPLVTGTLTAERDATVRAEVGGQILEVLAEEGQSVRKGAVLARIDARALADAVTSAQHAVRAETSAVEVAERELNRVRTLAEGGAIAPREIDMAQNTLSSAEARLADAKSRLATAQFALEDATVRVPFNGIIAVRSVNPGDVATMGTELFRVIDPAEMKFEASVPSDELASLRVGSPVDFTVRGYPGQTFTGSIKRISPMADSVTRQVPIIVTVPNTSGRLVAGLFAEGRVTREARTTLVVPMRAIDENGSKPTVTRIRDGKVERVEVELGLRDVQTERVELASGVGEGDILLVGISQQITPGTPVNIREAVTTHLFVAPTPLHTDVAQTSLHTDVAQTSLHTNVAQTFRSGIPMTRTDVAQI